MVKRTRLLINPLEKKVLQTIKKYRMIAEGDIVLIALSGGADSVFLLTFFNKFSGYLKIRIEAIHVNHLLRGKDSDNDELFCRNYCSDLGIALHVVRENIRELADSRKISIEEAGHDIRYLHFRNIQVGRGFSKTATAHHLNDNSETVLLNIIKGTGIPGLAGIAPVLDNHIIRPLIEIEKHELLEYLDSYKISYCNDASNDSVEYQRNFIRNSVIPGVKINLNPSVDLALSRLSFLARNIDDYLHKILPEIASGQIVEEKDGYLTLGITWLRSLHPFIQSELLRLILAKNFKFTPSFKAIESIKNLISLQSGRRIKLDKSLSAFRDHDKIVFSGNKSLPEIHSREIKIGEKIQIRDKVILIDKYQPNIDKEKMDLSTELVDGDHIFAPLTIRIWERGDKFIPLGMKGFKKISDFLADWKVPKIERENQLVVCSGGNIVWVVDRQIDDRVKMTDHTRNIIELSVKDA